MLNRTQALVLSFFVLAWIALAVILILSPEVYDQALKLTPGDHRAAELAFLLAITAFLIVLGVGVARRWRWAFWLILVAFLAGLLRVPTSALELLGVIPPSSPSWYAAFQAGIGLFQVAIGLTMLRGYRRAGVWGG